MLSIIMNTCFTSQQSPDTGFPCSGCFQEEINHIQILQKLFPHSYDLLIKLLLYFVNKLIVIRTILNLKRRSGQPLIRIQICFKTHHFDRNQLSVHRTGITELIAEVSKIFGNIFEDFECFIHSCWLFVQNEIRVDLMIILLYLVYLKINKTLMDVEFFDVSRLSSYLISKEPAI